MIGHHRGIKPLKRVILQEELVALTGSPLRAIILSRFLHWTGYFLDYDRVMLEEKIGAAASGQLSPHTVWCQHDTWFFKRMVDLKDEVMLDVSEDEIWRAVVYLRKKGWIDSRPSGRRDQQDTVRFRCHVQKIQQDLGTLGYVLPHFTLENPMPDSPCLSVRPSDKGTRRVPAQAHLLTSPDESDISLSDSSDFLKREITQ